MKRMTDRNDAGLSINRRALLKASGATAIGLTAFSGSVSASPLTEIRFCGCSQVCVKTSSSYRILYATETDDGYTCSLEPSITDAEPRSSDCYTAESGEKVIGVLDGQRTLYLNPNTCAQRAIEALGDLNDCTGCSANDGTAGDCIRKILTVDDYTQAGIHEYDAVGVTIRTRRCKPPDQWEDDPNGPPEKDDSNGPPEGRGPPNKDDSNGPPESRGSPNKDDPTGPPVGRGPPDKADPKGPPASGGPPNK